MMKEKNNLYVGLAYSAMDIGVEGTFVKEWSDINGHKCIGTFLLEKVEEKKRFKKNAFKGFKEYRTKQEVNGIENQFYRPDDLEVADNCNEVFLSWFIAPLEATNSMINVDEYMALPLEEIYNGLRAVEIVYQAGAKKEELNIPQEHLRYMK